MRYKTVGEIFEVVTDYVANGSFKSLKDNVNYVENGYAALIRLVDYRNNFKNSLQYIDKESYDFLSKTKLYGGEIVISNVGANAGTIFRVPKLGIPMSLGPNTITINTSEKITNDYYYYYFQSHNGQNLIHSIISGSAQPKFNKTDFKNLSVPYPSVKEQKETVDILSTLDKKIELNSKINTNLEEINKLYFSNVFKNTTNFIKASDIAEIKIGKTPPRKEKKWFSSEKGQIWVSIKDMNSSGSFILDSSEYLINNATNNFNIQKVSKNTVILSFKLTIGRVKITEQDMFTNEAIAQFKNAKLPFQFLYTYLKSFPYETLGSTSSIAKSINSKIVKNIPILHPEKYELDNYMSFAEPIFKEIELHQLENKKLLSIKDELLHRFFN